jgi:hypothetical protein
MALAKRDQLIQAVPLDRPDEPLRMRGLQFGARTGIWTTRTPADSIIVMMAAPLPIHDQR